MKTNELIKKRRLDLGLSLEDVGKALGVNKSTILRYESKDIEKMPVDSIPPLAKVLKCSPEYLMGWEEEPTPFVDDVANKFSERLRNAMAHNNLTQADLVRKTGINKGALSSYLSGNYVPKQNNIYALARALDVNEGWLLGYSDVANSGETLAPSKSDNSRKDVYSALNLGLNEIPALCLSFVSSLIRNERITKNISEADLVNKADIFLPDYLSFEMKEKSLDVSVLMKLIDVLEIDYVELSSALTGIFISASDEVFEEYLKISNLDEKNKMILTAIKKSYSSGNLKNLTDNLMAGTQVDPNKMNKYIDAFKEK